jgi:hypothetical protein
VNGTGLQGNHGRDFVRRDRMARGRVINGASDGKVTYILMSVAVKKHI